MADISPVLLENTSKEHTGLLVVAWLGVKSGDVCFPYKTALYPDRSVGNLSGALVAMKGTNLFLRRPSATENFPWG